MSIWPAFRCICVVILWLLGATLAHFRPLGRYLGPPRGFWSPVAAKHVATQLHHSPRQPEFEPTLSKTTYERAKKRFSTFKISYKWPIELAITFSRYMIKDLIAYRQLCHTYTHLLIPRTCSKTLHSEIWSIWRCRGVRMAVAYSSSEYDILIAPRDPTSPAGA